MLGTNDSEGYTLPGAKTFVDSLLADDPNCKIAIGILAAYFLAEHRAEKLGLNKDLVFGLVVWAVLAGLLGGELLF